jgi:hypothetical protein
MSAQEYEIWMAVDGEDEREADDLRAGARLLLQAAKTIDERGKAYGPPNDNFDRIVRRWNAHLMNRYGQRAEMVDALDVAAMMIDVKLARLEETVTHHDSLVDVCGYIACWKELLAD